MANEALAQVRGSILLNLRAYCVDLFGVSGWEATGLRLGPGQRGVVRECTASDWIPRQLFADLLRAMDDVHGAADRVLIVQAGRYQARADESAAHRLKLRSTSLESASAALNDHWRRSFDTGSWTVLAPEGDWFRGRLAEWGDPDLCLCAWVCAYGWGLVESVLGQAARFEHPFCASHGHPACEFRARFCETEPPPELAGSGSSMQLAGAMWPGR